MTTTSVLAMIGVAISYYKILSDPRVYFNGLFRPVDDKSKTDSLYLTIAVFTLISAPAHFLFNIQLSSLDVIATIVLSLVFLWKFYEIFKSPKKYFKGLAVPLESEGKTTFEPLLMVIISITVIAAYLMNFI